MPAAAGPRRRLTTSPGTIAVAACVLLALASLVVPATETFDAWGWLVWGRELRRLALDTTAAPSWKPLPVVFTTVASVVPGVAPATWMVIARAGGLLAFVGAYRLAHRFGGVVAGVVAAVALVVTPDGEARFLRLLLEGHTAPAEAALCLWAIDRHLAGRVRFAVVLVGALALLRPEAWPLLLLYGTYLWRTRPDERTVLVVIAVLIPVAWFGGDLWGSGNAWHGAAVAQVESGSGQGRWNGAWTRVSEMVAWPVWVAAATTGAAAVRRRRTGQDAFVGVLLAATAAWSLVVVAMCVVLRYAALSRFLLPAAAGLCVVAGIGAADATGWVRARPARRAGWIATAVVVAAGAVAVSSPRVTQFDDAVREARQRDEFNHELDDVIARAGGRDALVGCGALVIEHHALANPMLPALAWKLDVPLDRVEPETLTAPSGVVFAQPGAPEDLRFSDSADATLIAASRLWRVYAVACESP